MKKNSVKDQIDETVAENTMKKNSVKDQIDETVADSTDAVADSTDAVADSTDAAAKLESFKNKKREAAKRFKERRAAEKEERIKIAGALIQQLKDLGTYDSLSDEAKSFLENTANPVTTHAAPAGSVFTKMFGEKPEVGATITLRDAFTKTLLGKSNIDAYVKKWLGNGTVVKFYQNSDDILASTYVLEAIA